MISKQGIERFFPQEGFVRNVMVLSSGTVLGQFLVLIATPVITRLYTPSEYGVLGVYVSLLGMLTVIASLRYEVAIPVAKNEEGAANLLALSVVIAFFWSLTCGVFFLFLKTSFLRLFKLQALAPFLWLVPLGVFSTALYQSLTFWAVRKKSFKTLAKTKVRQSIGMIFTQILLGSLHAGPLGLLLGQIFGQSGGIVALVKEILNKDKAAFQHISGETMARVAKRYDRFPKLACGASFLDAITNQLPLLYMAAVFGAKTAGWLTLNQRIIVVPITLLSTSISQVYLGELSLRLRSNPEQIQHQFISLFKKLSIIGVLLVSIIFLAAPVVIPIVFGAKWSQAALYFKLLMPMYLLGFIATPVGGTLDILERQDIHLIREIIKALILIGTLSSAYFLKANATYTLLLLGVGGSLNYCLYILASWTAVKQYGT